MFDEHRAVDRAGLPDRPQLADERQVLLEKAIEVDDLYPRKLGELESAQQRMHGHVLGFDDFMAVHLLWVRKRIIAAISASPSLSGMYFDALKAIEKLRLIPGPMLIRSSVKSSVTEADTVFAGGWVPLGLEPHWPDPEILGEDCI